MAVCLHSLTGVLSPPCAQAANDRLLFWEVELPAAQVYLLGSMHLASADVYPLRAGIMQAWEASDRLVVELDISGPRALDIQAAMLARGRYPQGQRLSDELKPETWQALRQRLADNGLPPEVMQALRPGLVVTTLSAMEMMKLGLDPERGIDRYFLQLAHESKPILELETLEQQLDVVLDTADPELLVTQTLDQLGELESIMASLVDSWKRGDASALNRLVLEEPLETHPEYADLQKRMFDDRNQTMTERLMELQASGGTLFVVVGAGHLVGDKGIIALLRQRGFQPQPR
ncbi:MAG: TraB/GumN family protein [Pseudomonadota bacterium]